jgi:hypothetical protein
MNLKDAKENGLILRFHTGNCLKIKLIKVITKNFSHSAGHHVEIGIVELASMLSFTDEFVVLICSSIIGKIEFPIFAQD